MSLEVVSRIHRFTLKQPKWDNGKLLMTVSLLVGSSNEKKNEAIQALQSGMLRDVVQLLVDVIRRILPEQGAKGQTVWQTLQSVRKEMAKHDEHAALLSIVLFHHDDAWNTLVYDQTSRIFLNDEIKLSPNLSDDNFVFTVTHELSRSS